MPKGGRKPSKSLWVMVRGLTEEEWRVISAWAVVYSKNPLQLRLLTLLRSMEEYSHAIEKLTFESNDLKSLRHATKRWLIRTATRLAFYTTEVSGQVLDVGTLLRWGIHDEILEFIAEAKHTAKTQEEFGWLALLYEYELRAVKIIFEGDERTDRVAAVAHEAIENGKLVTLKAEIEHQSALYLEKGRNTLLTIGKFDHGLAATYFKSKFYRQSIDNWPISLQFQKLRIDEAIHYFMGESGLAARAAEKSFSLLERLESTRQSRIDEVPKCLFRLAAYYTELRNEPKMLNTIETLRIRAKSDLTFPYPYLRRFVHVLLRTSFVFEFPALSVEATRVWWEKKDVFDSIPKDAVRFETLLFLCAYYISIDNLQAARETFTLASEVSETFPYPAYQAVYKLLHLIILLDEQDERGLKSYGKNYKLHLKALLTKDKDSIVASTALEIAMLLCKESNLEGKPKLNVSLKKLRERLTEYQLSNENSFHPFVFPILKWVELRLKS